jgi:hypothetical protein
MKPAFRVVRRCHVIIKSMYLVPGVLGSAILVAFGARALGVALLLSTLAFALLHLAFVIFSHHRRSHVFRHVGQKYALCNSETRLPLWTIIAVDPAKGDAPFIWRTMKGRLGNHDVSVSDV